MLAVADGRLVHDARSHATELQNRVIVAQGEADRMAIDLRSQENLLATEGLTDEQIAAIRLRIRNLRIDRERQLSEVARLQGEADVAKRDADAVVNRFIPTYGG